MQFARAVRGIASACLVSMLAACGGGGGGDDPRTSTLTLETPTSATAVGTFTTQNHQKYTEATALGNATSVEFKFSNGAEAGFSYINNDRSIYIVGFSDGSGDYLCGSAAATSAIGIITCPSGIQIDIDQKIVKFTNAELEEIDGLRPNIRATGELQWN